MRTWLTTKPLILATLLIASCDREDDDDDTSEGGDPTGAATAGGSTQPGDSSPNDDESGGERVCGLVDPTLSGCDACAAESCCEVATACAADDTCSDCYFSADKPPSCFENPALTAFAECVNGPCAPSCSPSSGDGGSAESSPSCGAIKCSPDGPNSDCEVAGCGECSFGECLLF